MNSSQSIITALEELLSNRLQEREPFLLESVGLFTPQYVPPYIELRPDGTQLLMPPTIAVEYQPADYLLQGEHYTTLNALPPTVYLSEGTISAVADLSGTNETQVQQVLEDELKQFFTALFRGRRVALFTLGDFYVAEEVAGILILNYSPSLALLTPLQKPFSAFSPTPLLHSDLTHELELHEADASEEAPQSFAIHTHTPEPAPTEPIPEERPLTIEPKASPVAPTPQPKRSKAPWWAVGALAVVVALLLLYLFSPRVKPTPPSYTPIVTEQAPQPDPTPTPAPQPTPQPEPATSLEPLGTAEIVTGTTLASLAREYYQVTQYWVYIYMENQENITDPNRVPIGTQLTIPSLAKYSVNENSQTALHEAKQWERIILSGQFRSYHQQRATIQPFNP